MKRNKEEIILQIAGLLAQLIDEKEDQGAAVVLIEDKQIEMLTVKECAKLIKGLSEHTVRQLVAQGKIPCVRAGQGKRGKILISKAALLAYFNGVA